MEVQGSAGDITRLPEDCIAHVLSLTTPRDACRSAAAASAFRSAAEADAVWEKFLPADYEAVLARATEPVEFRSKKELYFRMCRPLIIDGGRKSFSLDKPTGKRCWMLSARDMWIVWGDTPRHWSWRSLPGSRFPEVAELLDVWWFEIGAKFSAATLTPKATYVAYLVYRLPPHSQGFSSPPPEARITVGPFTSKRIVRFQSAQQAGRANWRGSFFHRRNRDLEPPPVVEVALGEFVVDEGCDGEVEIVLSETSGVWKTGLILEGIEVRPKN